MAALSPTRETERVVARSSAIAIHQRLGEERHAHGSHRVAWGERHRLLTRSAEYIQTVAPVRHVRERMSTKLQSCWITECFLCSRASDRQSHNESHFSSSPPTVP